ncbi:MAG: glycosyltransferase family 4 protein [Haloarculaceae archaeon]
MRVCYLVGQGEGGLAHYTAELANAVADDHDVLVAKPAETDADDLFESAVDVVEPFRSIDVAMSKLYSRRVSLRQFLAGVGSYRRVADLRDYDVDVVHETTGLFPHVKYFAQRYGLDEAFPMVVTRHEVPRTRVPFRRPPVLLEECLDRLIPDLDAARTVVHTQDQRSALIERGYDPARVAVIPHGAYSVFGDHDSVETDPEPNTLLFFGNVVPPKGVDTLVKAVPHVRREVSDVSVVVAGDGQLPDDCRDVIAAYPEHFEIHNRYVPNEAVRDFFARASAVVLPYRDQGGTKGHSGALATAFSFGKPVVATTASNFPRLVEDSGSGLTVPPEDPAALADAIVAVLTDDRRRQAMAERSREMADRLSWDSVADQYVSLYREACDGAPDRRGERLPSEPAR